MHMLVLVYHDQLCLKLSQYHAQASLGNYTHDKCLEFLNFYIFKPDPVAQSIESLIADPGVVGSIPARPHTFMEIDRETFSTVILLLPLIQKGLLSVTI